MAVVSAIFWGLVVLSLLVVVHEGGHFLAARAFGVRVTEFYLGMPCRKRLFRKSRAYGTEFGVTPILLGGYNRICGMEGEHDDRLADCLDLVQRRGRVTIAEVARELAIDEERALTLLVTLADWASIRPYYDAEKGEEPGQRDWPEAFETLERDANHLTEYDAGHDFESEGTTAAGEPHQIAADPVEALSAERSHTYLGMGFVRRVVILLAGPLVNILLAFVIVTATLSTVGVATIVNTNVLGGVESGSAAERAGLAAGDAVVRIGERDCSDWQGVVEAIDQAFSAGGDFDVTYVRDGQTAVAHVVRPEGEGKPVLGVNAQTRMVPVPVGDAAMAALNYGATVATFAARLIMPQHTMETLSNTSSVVGISAAASQAAASGPVDLMLFVAMVSMSLGFMNLLPIPPLDGGKILVEVIQLVSRRTLSVRVQNWISYAGLAFFLFIFVFALKNDIFRLLF